MDVMKKVYFSLIVLLFSSFSAFAQMGHSFSVNLGGGSQNLFYNKVEDLSAKTSYNAMLSLGYRFYFHENWGVGTDIGISLWQEKSAFDGMTCHESYDTQNNLPYEFRAYFTDWAEKQDVLAVGIPLLVSYKCAMASDWSFVTNFGPKLNIPVSVKYAASGVVETRGYYPAYNVEISNTPQHGFTKGTRDFTGKNQLKLYPSVYIDLGFARSFQTALLSNNKTYDLIGNLYLGLYLDCGYMPLGNSAQSNMYELGADGNITYHSILEQNAIKSAVPLSCGIKVGVSIMSRQYHIRWLWK